MKIKLMNCYDELQEFTIKDKKLDNFLMGIYNLSYGDETLTIIYKDGSYNYFDSDTHLRIMSNHEEESYLINIEELKLINKLNKKADSYDRAYELYELIEKKRENKKCQK